MSAAKKRPVILSPLRHSRHHKAIAKTVQELADLRTNDPKAYEALIKKSAGRTVTIVPGRLWGAVRPDRPPCFPKAIRDGYHSSAA